METNPQLAQALNNPEVLRDAARAMSSPVRHHARTVKHQLSRVLASRTLHRASLSRGGFRGVRFSGLTMTRHTIQRTLFCRA